MVASEGMDAELAAAPKAAPWEGTGERVDLSQSPSDRQALALIPEAYAASHDLLPLTVAYVHRTVIPVEEARLQEVFGDGYAQYCVGVRRWL